MPAHKAVIFDLDGTLLDTLEDLADSVNGVLKILGFPARSLEEIRTRVGDGILNLIETSLPEGKAKDEKTVMKAVHEMGEIYSRRWNVKTKIYEGMDRVLDKLMLERIPMGILSNKPHPFTKTVCAHYLKKWDFVFTTGGREHLPLKPNPAAAYLALEEFQKLAPSLEAEDILFVGDGDTDMKTAVSAGMTPLGVLWGFRSRSQLASVGAKFFAEKPEDILGYLL